MYVFQEYPKHIYFPDGSYKAVQNLNEEREVRALLGQLLPPEQEDIDAPAVVECPEEKEFSKEEVWAQAEALGVIYDKRWKTERIIEEIRRAQARGVLSIE